MLFQSLVDIVGANVREVSQDPWSAAPKVYPQLAMVPEVLSLTDLDALLNREGPDPLEVSVVRDHKMVPADQFPSRVELEAFLENGYTVIFWALQRKLEKVKEFCEAVMAASDGVPSFGVAYLTPPGSQGFSPHWDLGSVTVLQVSGTKHWELREPVVSTDDELNTPWVVRGFRDGELDGEPCIQVQLRAGDCLFIPRGWVHSARATDRRSLHVSIGALHKGIDLDACHTVYP